MNIEGLRENRGRDGVKTTVSELEGGEGVGRGERNKGKLRTTCRIGRIEEFCRVTRLGCFRSRVYSIA